MAHHSVGIPVKASVIRRPRPRAGVICRTVPGMRQFGAQVSIEIDLKDRVAVITGGGRGIGKAITALFARAGARCVIASRKLDRLEETAAELADLPGQVLPVACHVGRADQIETLVETAVTSFGPVDILVNNAATNIQLGSLLEASDEQLEKMLEINLLSALRLCRAVAPSMLERGRGSIINISSISGLVPQARSGYYSITKAALNMLTRSLAQELGPGGVRVNALAPGLVQTDFSSYLWEEPERRKMFLDRQMLPGLAVPEQIAPAALFLASDQSSFVTGQVLVVDGGTTSGV